MTTTDDIQHKTHRLGLSGKLIIAMLAVGLIPLAGSLSVTYYIGSGELQEVIGTSFQVLAEDSAAKVDAEIQRIIIVDRILAHDAADGYVVKTLGHPFNSKGSGIVPFDWPEHGEDTETHAGLNASWVTGPEVVGPDGVKSKTSATEQVTTRIWLELNSKAENHQLHISTPILDMDEDATLPTGWLHRTYDINKLLDHLTYPIRFGDTGHVMIIDNLGTIVSCPLLPTGSHIADQTNTFIARITDHQSGWLTAENDGHGELVFSIIGHAPLVRVNASLQQDKSWHMFVWQDSEEIFAPVTNLLIGVALAGILALGLLVAMGYYASRRIVEPVEKLRQGASRIAAGDLSKPLTINTGDEIEDLAGEFEKMRTQLRQHIGSLEEKVEERTQELVESQAEKEQVLERLIQTEKVAAIGTMASGIGHEINNPLYVISGMAEAIRDEKDLAVCNKYGHDILKYAKEISAIVKNLSGYTRPASRHELEAVDVHEKLEESIAMAKLSRLDDHVEIQQNFTPVPKISAQPEEVKQVFFNIIRNGIQAIEGKGVLKLTTSHENDLVCIRITDTGKGIKEEHLGKIFDPFFTTKGPDEGEGLGMYIVQKIVNQYGGTITLETEEGKGTTFIIQFPARESDHPGDTENKKTSAQG
ncbi:MAG: ATP-binding protein [Mariprofundaceae bacterium]